MQELFYIYIDRLSEGKTETIDVNVDSAFLEVSDGNLFFPEQVLFQGSAYLADSHLVINLNVSTSYQTFCKICNDLILNPFTLKGLYITEEITNLSSKIFDLQEPLRDAILLEIPLFSECKGECPMRKELKKYFKQESTIS